MIDIKRKIALIKKAHEKYSNIRYTAKCQCLDDCFTEFNGNLVFWFTTDDDSTHIVKEDYVLLKELVM